MNPHLFSMATTATIGLLLQACGGLLYRPDNQAANEEPASETDHQAKHFDFDTDEEQVFDDEVIAQEDLEQEEQTLEDPAALDELISKLLDGEPPSSSTRPLDPSHGLPGKTATPVALENWRQSDKQCLDRLKQAGIRVTKPDFETPLIKTPLLLDGPIFGVEIKPRWSRSDRINEVMDCRLVLALVEVARQSKLAGVSQILFYSTYRPLKPPPEKCPAGKTGASCRKAKRKYDKALRRKHSQHRRGLAIDIRWFVTADGRTLDVLEHYERSDKHPPCDGEPQTDAGRVLQRLACVLHKQRIFNVILTPNSNKAHHNHFHFDITPDATWYVIK